MNVARRLALTAYLATVLASSIARADDAGVTSELSALEREVATTYAKYTQGALAEGDCALACRALASMRRATDRICVLEPGTRCADARRRTTEVEGVVRDACPYCVASGPEPAPPRAATPVTKPQPEGVREEANAPQHAPRTAESGSVPAESKRGGCAGCAVPSRDVPADAAGVAVALGLGLAVLARRRRRQRFR